jgi:hypothetical protein
VKIINDDIWKYHAKGAWVVVPTNSVVKKDGTLVMGAGLAKEAAKRFKDLPKILGAHVNLNGNSVMVFDTMRIINFPTKENYMDPADLLLIEQSAQQLCDHYAGVYDLPLICMPKVGCGLGGLSWGHVQPIIMAYLGDIVTIVDRR